MVKSKKLMAAGLLAVFGGILMGNLGGWDLWRSDEPRYAQVAREMMESGDYLTPRINAEPYPDKPPLFFWLVALASKPFGDVVPRAARLPSALAGLGMIALTCVFAARLYGASAGLMAAAVLFSSPAFFGNAVSVHLDTNLGFWILLCLFCFYRGCAGNLNKRYLLCGYACLGVAVSVKGPVAIGLVVAVVVVFLAAGRELRRLRQLSPAIGLLIVLGTVALWLVPACLHGGRAYTDNILFGQTINRIASSPPHQAPFYEYLIKFPAGFFPWSLFIPAAAAWFWKNRRRELGIAFPLAWFAAGFVYFSMIPSKRDLYLIPLYPAAAMLMAKFWSGCMQQDAPPARSNLFRVPCFILFGLFAAAGAVAAIGAAGDFSFIRGRLTAGWLLYAVAGVLVFGGIGGVAATLRGGRVGHCFCLLGACLTAANLITVANAFPAMNAEKSPAAFCRRIQQTLGPNGRLVSLFNPEKFNYYLHRYPIQVLKDPESAEDLLRAPEKTFFLVRERDYKRYPEKYRQQTRVLECREVGHRTVCFLEKVEAVQSDLKKIY